ncbi:ARM repeat-containing protein [Hesseltinella vesiculosa]|uniref:MMS19 nucleotide excision repair protein n=1 Tax=Hesseltinella vesiculosa TaxID=101127 RepID=A0A1X2GFW0_9FUNG|nr:ARM repeat-containing protein [Hesseltinella vesiculosa]
MALEKHVTDYMIVTGSTSSDALACADAVVHAVDHGNIQQNLLEMIQAMGEYLTNDVDSVRAKAIGLLSHTLNSLDPSNFNETAVSVLTNFYCDRLTDSASVGPLLDGLVALTSFADFNSANAVQVAKRLLENVEVQRQPQATRHLAYRVIKNLIDHQCAALRSINNTFVFGYCRLMDGEKDPRNLMLAFEIIRSIIANFDVSTHIEDLFEVTFCYFPITFKAPPDDPYGISADDLKTSLRSCLAATPHFAKFAVPLILEKLTSTSGSAKKDAMETLGMCAPVYGAAALMPTIHDLLDALKIEIFHASDQTLEDTAVDSLHRLVSAICPDGPISHVQAASDDPFIRAVKPLMDECTNNLKDADAKNLKQTGSILRAMASASDYACRNIINAILPLVLHSYQNTDLATRKKAMLDILLEFFEASRIVYGAKGDNVHHGQRSPLYSQKDRYFGMFETALMASNEYNNLRLCGLHGLKLMILHADYLSANEVVLAIQSFNKILLDETDPDLRSAALNSLETMTHIEPMALADQTVPALINHLPQSATDKQLISYPQLLYALKTLCPEPALFKTALPFLLEKLDHVCDNDDNQLYAQAIMNTFLDIIYIKATKNHSDLVPSFDALVWHMITKVIDASLTGNGSNVLLAPDMLDTISMTAAAIFQQMDSTIQKENIDKLFKVYIQGDIDMIGLQSATPYTPLKSDASDAQHSTTHIFAALVSSLRKDVDIPVASTFAFLNEMVALAIKSENPILLKSVTRIVGSLLNKQKQDTEVTEYIETATKQLQVIIEQDAAFTVGNQGQNSLMVYAWITKALIMKGQALGYQLTDKLIEWCAASLKHMQVPEAFDVLLDEDHLALNKACFATVSILYRQRLFSYCLPKLLKCIQENSDDIKHNYLIALSYLLKNVPKQILLNELPPLVPLMILALSLPDATLKVATLESFTMAATEAPDVIAVNIQSLLPALLNMLDTSKESNPMNVRVAALKCLAQLATSLSRDVALPHAHFVTKQLARSLDDRKRLVRREAVDCRAKWFAIIS